MSRHLITQAALLLDATGTQKARLLRSLLDSPMYTKQPDSAGSAYPADPLPDRFTLSRTVP